MWKKTFLETRNEFDFQNKSSKIEKKPLEFQKKNQKARIFRKKKLQNFEKYEKYQRGSSEKTQNLDFLKKKTQNLVKSWETITRI